MELLQKLNGSTYPLRKSLEPFRRESGPTSGKGWGQILASSHLSLTGIVCDRFGSGFLRASYVLRVLHVQLCLPALWNSSRLGSHEVVEKKAMLTCDVHEGDILERQTA